MILRVDPDRILLRAGEFIGTPLFDPSARIVQGLLRPRANALKHQTAVIEVLRLGPAPCDAGPYGGYFPSPTEGDCALALAPFHRRGDTFQWTAADHPSPWPFEAGAIVLMPRDFSVVADWNGRRFVVGQSLFAMAVLEGDRDAIIAGFEWVPPEAYDRSDSF